MIQKLESIGITNIQKLNGFHNLVYKGEWDHKTIIIRCSNRRSQTDIQHEIDVLLQLSTNIRFARPLSINGSYVLHVSGTIMSFYEYIDGSNWYETTLTEEVHFNAGKELGLLHLELMNLKANRQEFMSHPDVKMADFSNQIVHNAYQELLETLTKYPRSPKEYGLIHGDYLYSNLMYQGDNVSIIDFDDMEYHFFLYDVAVYLFYLLLGGDPSNIEYPPNVLVFQSFIQGYRSVNDTVVFNYDLLNHLFRWRQFKLYFVIKGLPKESLGEWQLRYLALFEHQLNHKLPFAPEEVIQTFQSMDCYGGKNENNC